MLLRFVTLAGLVACASAAQSQVVFSDNFDADLRGLNKTTFVGGWTVGTGTVDVIGAGPGNEPGAGPGQAGNATGYNFIPGNGNYIDLDGSGVDSGAFTKTLSLIAGTQYVASFQLAGSQRNFTESVNVSFGTAAASYSYGRLTGFTTSQLTFTPTVSGSYALTFNEPGASNFEGLLLDNVSVVAVPEPQTFALLLAGLASVGFIVRRRRQDF